MAATQVTSANTNLQSGGARVSVRTSVGIPYVVTVTSGGDIQVWKGNSTSPSSFAEQDSANNPSNARYGQASAAIDSTGVIHIAYFDSNGKSSALRYVTFNTSTDTFSGDTSIQDIGGASPTNPFTAIAIDANDVPHVAWVDSNANMGTNYDTVYYTNKVGGSWNTAVEVEGQANQVQCGAPDIAIDADNEPIISYKILSTSDSQGKAAQGNTTNATSFTLQTVISDGSDSLTGASSIVVDSSGNHYAAYFVQNGTTRLSVWKHSYGAAWSSWTNTSLSVGSSSTPVPALVADGTDIYVFYEDANSDIVYDKYTGTWAGPTVLETGTYNTSKAKWAFWVDNDSGGGNLFSSSQYTGVFDGSDLATPVDNNNVWTDETNIDDGSTSTFGSTTSTGNTSSNWVRVEGTNASFSGDFIAKVEARIYGGAETDTGSNFGYGNWKELTVPSGGWTLAKIQALEAKVYGKIFDAGLWNCAATIYTDGLGESLGEIDSITQSGNSFISARAYSLEFRVTVYSRSAASELDYTFTDETASPDVWWNILSLATGSNFTQALTASLTVTDALANGPGKLQSAAVTLADAITRDITRALTAAVTLADTVVKLPSRTLSAALTLVDTLDRLPNKVLTAALTLADTIATVGTFFKSLAASLTLSDAIAKQPGKALTAALSLVATLGSFTIGKVQSAAVTLADTIARTTTRTLSAALTLAATVAKQTSRALTKAVTLTATVDARKIVEQALSAALALADTVSKLPGKTLAATVTITAALGSMSITKLLTAAVSLADTIARQTTRAFAEAVSLAATITRTPQKALSAALSLTAMLATVGSFFKALTASVSLTAAVKKLTSRTLLAVLSLADTISTTLVSKLSLTASLLLTASVQKLASRSLTAAVAISDTLAKQATKALTASLTLADTLTRTLTRTLSETVALTDAITHRAGKTLSASLALADTLARSPAKVLNASLSLTATVSRVVSTSLTAAIALTATLARSAGKKLTASLTLADVIDTVHTATAKIVRVGKAILLSKVRDITTLGTKAKDSHVLQSKRQDSTTLSTDKKDGTILGTKNTDETHLHTKKDLF